MNELRIHLRQEGDKILLTKDQLSSLLSYKGIPYIVFPCGRSCELLSVSRIFNGDNNFPSDYLVFSFDYVDLTGRCQMVLTVHNI